MKHILPIILLFPFALQAMHEGTTTLTVQDNQIIYLNAILSQSNHEQIEGGLMFDPNNTKHIHISEFQTSLPHATAIIRILKINKDEANIQCQLQYTHTNKWAYLLPCVFNKHVNETVSRDVTVKMNQPIISIPFGNSSYLQHKKSSQIIPTQSMYKAQLDLQLSKQNN